MGAGKTTLGQALSQRLGYTFIPEDFEDNPYLEDSTVRGIHKYENIRWFIDRDFSRYQRACELAAEGQGVVVDKPFFEEFTYIAMAGLTEEEVAECNALVGEMLQQVRPPDISLDLSIKTPQLAERIAGRGREFEGAVSQEWLETFRQTHEAELYRIEGINRLPIDAEALDFRNPEDVETIIRMMQETLE